MATVKSSQASRPDDRDPRPSSGAGAREGDRDVTKDEGWLEGLTIADAREFRDTDGRRWRRLTFTNGTMVEILLTAPWLVLERVVGQFD